MLRLHFIKIKINLIASKDNIKFEKFLLLKLFSKSAMLSINFSIVYGYGVVSPK